MIRYVDYGILDGYNIDSIYIPIPDNDTYNYLCTVDNPDEILMQFPEYVTFNQKFRTVVKFAKLREFYNSYYYDSSFIRKPLPNRSMLGTGSVCCGIFDKIMQYCDGVWHITKPNIFATVETIRQNTMNIPRSLPLCINYCLSNSISKDEWQEKFLLPELNMQQEINQVLRGNISRRRRRLLLDIQPINVLSVNNSQQETTNETSLVENETTIEVTNSISNRNIVFISEGCIYDYQ